MPAYRHMVMQWATLLFLCWPGWALAQVCTGTMDDIDFGDVSTIATGNVDISGTLNISCTGFATPNVRICSNFGLPSGGGYWGNPVIQGPAAASLPYAIYQDSAHTRQWTSVFDPQPRPYAADLPLTGGAGVMALTYYARIAGSHPTVPVGAYLTAFTTKDTWIQSSGYTTTAPGCSTGMGGGGKFAFNVRARVVADCMISATNIDFGQHGFMSGPANSTGIITATCTNGTPYALSLDAGKGGGANFEVRRMTRNGGSETLNYSLYTDTGHTQVWGDGSAGTGTVSLTGTGNSQTRTVYAQLPAQPAVAPGTYVDTIIMTITY